MDNTEQNNNNYSREEAYFKYFGDKWPRWSSLVSGRAVLTV